MPDPSRDLAALLATLRPQRRPGTWVFVCVPAPRPDLEPVVAVQEDEGLTLVVRREAADVAGLGYAFVAAMITLGVHSALDAVGLTAAVATALADEGISANVVAGFHHDHLFVPTDRAGDALAVLAALSGRA